MTRKKRCPARRCPALIPSNARYCSAHLAEYEERRGTSAQRGYDHRHRRARARQAERVALGIVQCARCGKIILPNEPWDLGHTDDRHGYLGAEHQYCNRAAGGRNGAKVTNSN